MDKKLVKAFVQECIDVQDWEARFKANHIEMNEWFKYSGKIEIEKPLYEFKSQANSKWIYNQNRNCYQLSEIIKNKIKKYEKNKKNTSEFVESTSANTWK